MKRLTERIVALLIAVMTMTAQTARAQEPGEPDLGRIICDPANVNGGSLSFYYSYDSEQGSFNQISIDGTTHMSDKLRSTDWQSMDYSSSNCIYIKGNPDAAHVLSGYTITAKNANNEIVDVYYKENEVYYFVMPADGSDVIFTATFKGMFEKAKLGDEGHPHINFVTFDNTGKRQTVSTADLTDPVYVLDGSEKHLGQSGSETWYVAKRGINYTTAPTTIHDCGIILDGTVHLILADGADVNTNCEDEHGSSINGNNNSLILYSQGNSASEGKFTIRGGGDLFVESISSFIINGGVINSLSERYSQFTANNVTIRGGKVTFSREDKNDPAVYGNITILGGQVTVVGKMVGGNITLGWTDATDFIKASSYEYSYYNGWMKIADGQAMMADGTNSYSGTLDDGQIAALAGKTLTPHWTGTGVDADHAYMINRPGELDLLAQRVNSGTGDADAARGYSGKFFKLANDIAYDPNAVDANGENYTAIGYDDYETPSFRGTFDGQGHTISGIRINKDHKDFQGLFSYVNGGTVKNVTLADASITGNDGVGGIVSLNNGTIENCLVIGTTISTISGGVIVGSSLGSLSHNYYSDCELVYLHINESKNTNIGTKYGDITSNDGAVPAIILSETEAAMPAMSENDKVVFRRSFTQGKASTVCLPFAIDATQAAAVGKFYEFVGVDKSGAEWEVVMQEADMSADPPVTGNEASTLAANTPYLFMPAATGPVLFYGTAPASVSAGETSDTEGWTFKGTYEKIEWTSDPQTIYGFASGVAYGGSTDPGEAGEFVRVRKGGIVPFRAYLDYTAPSSSRGTASSKEALPETMIVRLLSANGTTTGIEELRIKNLELRDDAWYDLMGRKIEKPTAKGVYIYKGKKVKK